VLTIRQFMDANPALSGEAVLNAYLSKLCPESVAGSCINQTATGCALPRDMRSATCNGYYCEPLKKYQEKAAQGDVPRRVFAVQRAKSDWGRSDITRENRIVNVALVDHGVVRFFPD
jgi:hypothetical protein